jgi:heme/copper-type cytochrome/quinol oxidase subunit 1
MQGRPRVIPGVPHAVAFALVLGAGSLLPIVAALVGLEGADATAFANGQLTVVVLGPALLGLAAGIDYWAPKLMGRRAIAAVSALVVLALLGGVTVTALGQYLAAFGVDAALVTTAGVAMLAAAVLALVVSVAGRAELASADPYDGLTLEWLAASPPQRYNFDELPPIKSAYPLHDLRESAAAGEAGDPTDEAVED